MACNPWRITLLAAAAMLCFGVHVASAAEDRFPEGLNLYCKRKNCYEVRSRLYLLIERKGRRPPWRQPRGKWMVSLANSHTHATRIGWHLWEIDLRFAHGLPPGWFACGARGPDALSILTGWILPHRVILGEECKSMRFKYEPASELLHISARIQPLMQF